MHFILQGFLKGTNVLNCQYFSTPIPCPYPRPPRTKAEVQESFMTYEIYDDTLTLRLVQEACKMLGESHLGSQPWDFPTHRAVTKVSRLACILLELKTMVKLAQLKHHGWGCTI